MSKNTPKVKFTIVTLFPEALEPYLSSSMLYKAREKGIIEINYVNLRDFGIGAHRSVDDTPYGGGDGMLLRCEPAFAAIESVKEHDPAAKVILPTPVGATWNQELARRFAGIAGEDSSEPQKKSDIDEGYSFSATNRERTEPAPDSYAGLGSETLSESWSSDSQASAGRDQRVQRVGPESATSDEERVSAPSHYIIFCPHYEGYDERIMSLVDYPISLGQYVLTGGELPALILIDSITRLIPGVLGGETSAEIESFSDGDNLEYPQYTKPAEFRGMKVPDILLSGHHAKIAEWRKEQSEKRRQENR